MKAVGTWLHSYWLTNLVLSLFTGLFLIQNINLPTADIGRHLMNGQQIWQQGFSAPILSTNYYSYTQTTFAFPNHHWLYGVLIWPIYQMFSTGGLVMFNAVLLTASVALVAASTKATSRWSLLIAWLICLPLLIWRTEVRPENFSLLLTGLLIFLLKWFEETKISPMLFLGCLFFIGLFWVNIHLFFPLSLALVGFSLAKNMADSKQNPKANHRALSLVLGLLILCASFFINPNGWRGVLVPFTIFSHYPYPVAENQTTGFFLRYYSARSIHWYFMIFSSICLILMATAFAIKRSQSQTSMLPIVLDSIWSLGLIMGGLVIVRLYPLIGLLSLPILISFIDSLVKQYRLEISGLIRSSAFWLVASPVVFAILIFATSSRLWLPVFANFGVGFQVHSLDSSEFLKQLPNTAKIFNNYDVGGYLIFTLPNRKVFVDNRPESYSAHFMRNQYIKPQQDEQAWKDLCAQYGLNLIFFYRHDATDWAQPFLIRRLQDPEWVPVYVDDYFIALAKSIPDNQQLINQHRLPSDMFKY